MSAPAAGGIRVPHVTGLSPKEGAPGTQITIRGEHLGVNAQDLLAVFVCGTDCTVSARWESSHKVIARVGQAKAGAGDVIVMTKSGGKGTSALTFKVVHIHIRPDEESAVWVDESRTVPRRSNVDTTAPSQELDVLGQAPKTKGKAKYTHVALQSMFPNQSGNLRMSNFEPAWYLLENYPNASVAELRAGVEHLRKTGISSDLSPAEFVRNNVHSYVQCVDALDRLRLNIQDTRARLGWPVTTALSQHIGSAHDMSDSLFASVLRRKDVADASRSALSLINRFKFIFFLPQTIQANMDKGDYGQIITDYERAKAFLADSHGDVALFRELFKEINERMLRFKEELKQRLHKTPTTQAEQKNVIKYLLLLEPQSDPGLDCLTVNHGWLEDLLWSSQQRYANKVNERLRLQQRHQDSDSDVNSPRDGDDGVERFEFVNECLLVLSKKLPDFYQLMQSYINGSLSTNTNLHLEHEIESMVVHTTNLCSWMMLNALLPESLPASVRQQYADKFTKWPASVQLGHLLAALRKLRIVIAELYKAEVKEAHVQPLVELSVTLRIKCAIWVAQKTVDSVLLLARKEHWKLNVSDPQYTRTQLPDLFETQVTEMLPVLRQLVVTDTFRHEPSLYDQPAMAEICDHSLQLVLGSFTVLVRRLLRLDADAPATPQRPHSLNLQQQPTPRSERRVKDKRLVIGASNCRYAAEQVLNSIRHKLTATGLNNVDALIKGATDEFDGVGRELIEEYLCVKCVPLNAVLQQAAHVYTDESDSDVSDGVSNYVHDMLLCLAGVHCELFLAAPAYIDQVLSRLIAHALATLTGTLQPTQTNKHTQMALDVSALLPIVDAYAKRDQQLNKLKHSVAAVLTPLMPKTDRNVVNAGLRQFHSNMRVALLCFEPQTEKPPQKTTIDDADC